MDDVPYIGEEGPVPRDTRVIMISLPSVLVNPTCCVGLGSVLPSNTRMVGSYDGGRRHLVTLKGGPQRELVAPLVDADAVGAQPH